jgi:hypothetical protein
MPLRFRVPFHLQGSSYTLAGRADVMFSAFQRAAADLASARADHALVIRLDAFAALTMRGYWLSMNRLLNPRLPVGSRIPLLLALACLVIVFRAPRA